MQDLHAPSPAEPPGRAAVAATNVFLSPSRAFDEIRRGAPWWVPFLILVILAVVAAALSQPLQTAIAEARLSQVAEAQREAASAQMRVGSIVALVFAPIQQAIGLLLCALVFLGVLRGAGHDLTFKQSFAAQCYAGLVSSGLGGLVMGLLIQMKARAGSMSGMADLPRLGLDLLGGEGFARGLLGAFNPFAVWWLVILVYGFAAFLKRTPRQVTVTVLVAGILWLLLGGALAGVGYTFASR